MCYNILPMKIRRVLIVLLALFLALAGGLYYASQSLLPAMARDKVVAALSGLSQSRVTLKDVRLDILRGIVLRDLIVYDKDDATQEILKISEASASLLVLPWFKEKKIVIPGARLSGVRLLLRRDKDNAFNLNYLATARQSPTGASIVPFINTLHITEANVIFIDAAFEEPLTYEARIDKANIGMSLDKVSWNASGTLKHNEKQAPLEIRGAYQWTRGITNNRLVIRGADPGLMAKKYLLLLPVALETNIIPEIRIDTVLEGKSLSNNVSLDMKNFGVTAQELTLTQAAGHIELKHTATIAPWTVGATEGTIRLTAALASFKSKDAFSTDVRLGESAIVVNHNSQDVAIKADLAIAEANAQANTYTFSKIQGTVHAEGKIPLAEKIPVYSGTAQLTCAQISGVPRLEKIRNASVAVDFNNDAVAVREASVEILNTVVTGKADIAPDSIMADLHGEFDFTDLLPFVPKNLNLPDYQISGAAETKVRLEIKPGPATTWTASGEAILKDVWLKLTERNIVLASNQGRITFDTGRQNIAWHMPGLEYDEEFYSCDGHLEGFLAPRISAVIIGRDLKISAEGVKNDAQIRIESLRAQFKDSHTNLSGVIDLDEEQFHARGSILLNTQDLPAILPKTEKAATNAGLLGKVLLRIASISGPLKDIAACKLKATAETQLLSAYGYRIKNVSLDYEQIDRQGYVNDLSFIAYKGQGLIKGRIDMAQKDVHYALRGTIDGLELQELKIDVPFLKDQACSGTLKLNVSVQGQTRDTKTIKGGGSFQIKDGNIWQLKPLKGLGTFLFIPRFELLTFTSALGDFYIQDGYASTDNLELNSAELGLIAEGKIGFDGELDFVVNTQIPTVKTGEDLTERVAEVAQAVTKAGSLTAIKITGNVKAPKYKLQAIGENIAKKFSDILSNITP